MILQALFVFPLFTSLLLYETAAKQYFFTIFNRKKFSKNVFLNKQKSISYWTKILLYSNYMRGNYIFSFDFSKWSYKQSKVYKLLSFLYMNLWITWPGYALHSKKWGVGLHHWYSALHSCQLFQNQFRDTQKSWTAVMCSRQFLINIIAHLS